MRPIWSALLFVDKAANWTIGWLFGGGLQPWGATLSDRFFLLREQRRIVGIVACTVLDRLDPRHCYKAIQDNRS